MFAAVAPVSAAAPQVRTQGPSSYRIMLGDFEVTALLDGTHRFPAYRVLARAKPRTDDRQRSLGVGRAAWAGNGRGVWTLRRQ
jgi:hypothetical protein